MEKQNMCQAAPAAEEPPLPPPEQAPTTPRLAGPAAPPGSPVPPPAATPPSKRRHRGQRAAEQWAKSSPTRLTNSGHGHRTEEEGPWQDEGQDPPKHQGFNRVEGVLQGAGGRAGALPEQSEATAFADEGRGAGAPAKWSLQECDARG